MEGSVLFLQGKVGLKRTESSILGVNSLEFCHCDYFPRTVLLRDLQLFYLNCAAFVDLSGFAMSDLKLRRGHFGGRGGVAC